MSDQDQGPFDENGYMNALKDEGKGKDRGKGKDSCGYEKGKSKDFLGYGKDDGKGKGCKGGKRHRKLLRAYSNFYA